MILNINFNDNDHSINLLGDAIFQFLELFQSKCTPYFLQNVARYIFLIIKRNERVPYEFKEQNVLESKAEIGSAIIYCKRDCCSKVKFFSPHSLLCFYKCCDTTRPFVLFKLSVRLIRHPQVNNSAIDLHEFTELSYVPCKLCQRNKIYLLGKVPARAWHSVCSGKYFSKDTTELMIEYLRFRVYPIQYFCFDIVVSVCYSGS